MQHSRRDSCGRSGNGIEIISFSNETKRDKKLLKKFVYFHWDHYREDSQYIPLLDYEYLGFKLLGIKGFFEKNNLFFEHAEGRFFLALDNDEIVGRCMAFVNYNHNKRWNDKVGFFGQFESKDDHSVAGILLDAAGSWLKSKGLDTIRGPQNLPVNDATPGILTDGFNTRPVMYYHYNYPYYENLMLQSKFKPVKRVFSWEVSPSKPWEEKLVRVAKKVVERYDIKIETWEQRPLDERKQEMFEIYNEAWNDNWGFVPFTRQEFYHIIDEMQLIMDKGLFIFMYIKDELAAFFGGVPNIAERMVPINGCHRCELLRAGKLLLTKNRIKGFRLGYLGVKKKFRRLGLDGVTLWKQKQYSQEKGYEYCDMGWVLEDNTMTIRLIEMMGATLSKTYTVFEKPLA